MDRSLQSQTKLGRHGNISPLEQSYFDDAASLLPGGVLGGNALAQDARFVFDHGRGSRFWDVSGNEYIDYVLCSGAMFLGHAHPAIQKAVTDQVTRGTHAFAYLNETAIRLAKRLMPYIRCGERIRFTTAGSDSTFHAIRLSRAFTGREKILKFEGGYHGVHDYAQLSTAPRTKANFPQAVPDTKGIPSAVQDLMLVAPFNDPDTLASILSEHGHEIAASIVEPIQRIIMPKLGFLQAVSNLGYVGLAVVGRNYPFLVGAIVVENFCGGLVAAGFMAFLMSLCTTRFSATQFALLSSLMGVSRDVLVAPAGRIAQATGWPVFFLITLGAAIPGMLLLPLLAPWSRVSPIVAAGHPG